MGHGSEERGSRKSVLTSDALLLIKFVRLPNRGAISLENDKNRHCTFRRHQHYQRYNHRNSKL